MFPSNIYIGGKNYRQENEGVLPSSYFFIRVLHELELADNLPHTTPPSRPEVRAFFSNHFSPFDRGWQMLAWGMNPYCTAGNMTAVYHTHLWIANDHGTGDNDKPVANYFENKNLDCKPIAVENLTCGGNLLRVLGEERVKTNVGLEDCYIVETLDWHNSPPTVEWMDKHPWLYTWAVNMGNDGTPRRFTYGMQPNGYVPGVRHPLVCNPTDYVIAIQKWRCVEWKSATPPDSYKLYII